MQITTQNHYAQAQPGMNGFFSWIRKTLKVVGAAVALVAPAVGGAMIGISYGMGQLGIGCSRVNPNGDIPFENGGMSCRPGLVEGGNQFVDVPLTAKEESALDLWVNQKFMPFFNEVLLKLKEHQATVEDFIQAANYAADFADASLAYASNINSYEGASLSPNMAIAKSQFIEYQAASLLDTIQEIIANKGYAITEVITSKSINTAGYAYAPGYQFTGSKISIPEGSVFKKAVSTTPTIPDETDVIDATNETEVVTEPKTEKFFTVKRVGTGILVGIIVGKILSSGNKDKKK